MIDGFYSERLTPSGVITAGPDSEMTFQIQFFSDVSDLIFIQSMHNAKKSDLKRLLPRKSDPKRRQIAPKYSSLEPKSRCSNVSASKIVSHVLGAAPAVQRDSSEM
jgi:hypothetical protein